MYVLGCALRLHLSFPIESLSFAAMTYKYVQVAELFCISTGHEFFVPSLPLKTSYRECGYIQNYMRCDVRKCRIAPQQKLWPWVDMGVHTNPPSWWSSSLSLVFWPSVTPEENSMHKLETWLTLFGHCTDNAQYQHFLFCFKEQYLQVYICLLSHCCWSINMCIRVSRTCEW